VNKPLNARQERFCQAFVHFGQATVAAREAGYAPRSCKQQGWRMLRTDRVRSRIRAIQAELADHRGRKHNAIVGKLEVVYQRALEDHHFYAAARAAELQARIVGVHGARRRAPWNVDRNVDPWDRMRPKGRRSQRHGMAESRNSGPSARAEMFTFVDHCRPMLTSESQDHDRAPRPLPRYPQRRNRGGFAASRATS